MDMKSELLISITARLQQTDSFGLAESNKLAEVVSRQGLLTEQPRGTTDQHSKWLIAANTWLESLLQLITSTQATKSQLACRLAAASLTGCSSSLFVEHYNAYVVKVLEIVRKQSAAKTSLCHVWPVITAAFSRIEQLLNLPGLRRDSSSLAPKLMAALQPILATTGKFETGAGAATGRIAPDLMKAVNAGLRAVPTAFRTHQKSLESFATGLLTAPGLHMAVRIETACLYSLLPRLTGDAETWSSYMQNALCACHARLDIAYLGMDDSPLSASSKAALDPEALPLSTPPQAGNDRQPGQQGRLIGQSVHSVGAVQAALDQLAGFLDILERMLTLPFPVAAPIPAHGILMLLTRILSTDDSARQAGQVPPSASAYLVLLAALPALHTCALQLVQTLLQASQGALLLHYASLAKLLSSLLHQVAASAAVDSAPAALQLRQQVYLTAGELLTRGGRGVGPVLGPEAVKCALLELYGTRPSKKRPAEEGLANGHPHKKQKKNKKDDSLPSLDAMLADGALGSTEQQSSSDLNTGSAGPQEAALHLLQSLLQAWGSSMSQLQRSQIDVIVAHIASTAAVATEQLSQSFEGNSRQTGTTAVQLAAFKALLASVLCPAPHRPSFLPQALMLFTQGLTSPVPQLVDFSQRALLSVDGFIHPRSAHTLLQSHRPAASTHPYTSARTSSDQVTDLGMPQLWSAIAPMAQPAPVAEPTPLGQYPSQQQQLNGVSDTAVIHDVVADAAGTAAAREVLKAGQVYTAAVAKLEAALGGSATLPAQPTAVKADINMPAGEVTNQQQLAAQTYQGLNGIAAADAATGLTANAGATATENGKQCSLPPAPGPGKLPTALASPAETSTAAQQQGSGVANATVPMQSDAMEEDGYISLEQQSVVALNSAVSDAQQATAASSLLTTAESSDSQGSLPEIDSGESSDSSAME